MNKYVALGFTEAVGLNLLRETDNDKHDKNHKKNMRQYGRKVVYLNMKKSEKKEYLDEILKLATKLATGTHEDFLIFQCVVEEALQLRPKRK